MIVPEERWWFYDINPMASGSYHGSIGTEVERAPDDPSWLLI